MYTVQIPIINILYKMRTAIFFFQLLILYQISYSLYVIMNMDILLNVES